MVLQLLKTERLQPGEIEELQEVMSASTPREIGASERSAVRFPPWRPRWRGSIS